MPGAVPGTFRVLTQSLRDLSSALPFILRDPEAEVHHLPRATALVRSGPHSSPAFLKQRLLQPAVHLLWAAASGPPRVVYHPGKASKTHSTVSLVEILKRVSIPS